jgi:DMSO/TMAO reductase YedYZ molybdopterin-dependent catalytic subunit
MLSRKPSLWMGALVGGLLTAPLIAILAIGQRLAGLPFLPSDFFNPVRDLTPGDLLVSTIQRMVDVIINLNLGRVDQAAKQIEGGMAIGMIVTIGVISGVIFFWVFNKIERRNLPSAGLIGGLVVGIPMALISHTLGFTNTLDPKIVGTLWLVVLFLAWGIAHAWVYGNLAQSSNKNKASTDVVQIDRRKFLITFGAASATLTVVGAGLTALLNRETTSVTTTPTTSAALTENDGSVQPAPGTRAEITPLAEHYRIDISLIPPVLDEKTWTLPFVNSIGGSDELLAEFTLDQIKVYEATEAFITMSCISNRVAGDLISTIKWTGVSMQTLLADVPMPENAAYLKMSAADGFDETISLEAINNDPRIMIAYYWEDKPLTTEHGFPIRIHIPDLYGMKQPKWITNIEVLDADQEGYWVRRGWDKVARVRATSVIDTVAVDAAYSLDDEIRIPVGGIAWSGDRGISAVEVQVDDGEWQPAMLREPIGDRTWTIWRYDWVFVEGDHTFTVRCVEGDGSPQIEAVEGVRPMGATGLHSVRENGLTISGTPAPEPGRN